jgi:large subunit ribosomal protein L25
MMNAVLEAQERTEFRRSALTRLRNEGNIPAIIYGVHLESKPVSVNGAELLKLIRTNGRNSIISLNVNGKTCNVILGDYQTEPLKQEIIHADFLAVDMTAEIQVSVRIQLDGEACGVKDGGVLQQTVHEVSITTLPDKIPQAIHVDISKLAVGEHLTVADLPIDEGITINNDPNEVIVTILPPKVEEEISTGEQQDGGIPDNLEGRETNEKVE